MILHGRSVRLAGVFLLASTPAARSSPPTTWLQQFGNPGVDSGFAAVADGIGGVYVAGALSHLSVVGLDGFIYHFDAWGTETSSTVISSGQDEDVRSITVDKSSGSIFATGVTNGSLGGPFVGALDIYVGRFSTNGSTIWMRQFGTADFDVPSAISRDSIGNIYIVGETAAALFAPDLANYDAFIMKLDDAGNVIWTKQFGTNSFDSARDVWTDATGNAYVTGRSSNDAYVWKFDPQGNLSWAKEFATAAFDAGQAIQGDALGNIYVGGVTDGGLMGVNLGDRDAFVAKLDTSGDLQWITQIGTNKSDGVIDLTVDELGNPYIAGWTGGILGATNSGERDAYISKLDRTRGSVLFTIQLGTVGEDQANGVAVDGLGNFFATGYVRGDLAGTLSGTDDVWVAKFAVPEPSSAQFLSIAALLLFVTPGVSRRPPLLR